MAGHNFAPIWEAASAYFDRLERYVQTPNQTQLSEDDNREARELDTRVVEAAGALLALGQSN